MWSKGELECRVGRDKLVEHVRAEGIFVLNVGEWLFPDSVI